MLRKRFNRILWRREVLRKRKQRLVISFLWLLLLQVVELGGNGKFHRRWWVHPINLRRGVDGNGEFHAQIQQLKGYPDRFYSYFRMTVKLFHELLHLVGAGVEKSQTNWRRPISAEERLAVTLR